MRISMKRFGMVVLSIVMMGGAMAFSSPAAVSAAPATGDTIGVSVQLLDGAPPAPYYMQTTIARGSSHTYHIRVTNTGTTTQTFAAFASASIGLWAGGPAAQPTNVVTGWNSISPGSATLAPGESAVFTDTISVPSSATPGAQPLAVFWGYVQGHSAGQITMAAAAGIREYITVG